jgi:DNA helicase-2/ATP-dependent DNA helicase PcrA
VQRHPDTDRQDAQEVVDMFLGYARQYDEANPEGGLIGFLEQAALVSDVDGWSAQASAVPFMTLHSAKGLEFDAVFLVGVEEDILPHRRALEDDLHSSEQAALEEERRLFYVGMTRARKRLAITYALTRMFQGRELESSASRFISELPEEGVRRETGRPAGAASGTRFSREMEAVLRKKRPSLRITEAGARLGKGTRVSHDRYGEGEIIEVNPMGSRHLVRVNFAEHGAMALVLGPEDISRA